MKCELEYQYKIVNQKLFLLKRIRPCITVKVDVDVARSMILSITDYGNIFLTGCTQGDNSDLQILQNRI